MSNRWVRESPITDLTEGCEPTYSITFESATSVSASGATMEIYKNGSGADLASTMLTGSLSASGNVFTCKKISSLVGGNTYVFVVTCAVDGVTETRKCELVVDKKKDLQ